jgi:hypothetical protein
MPAAETAACLAAPGVIEPRVTDGSEVSGPPATSTCRKADGSAVAVADPAVRPPDRWQSRYRSVYRPVAGTDTWYRPSAAVTEKDGPCAPVAVTQMPPSG